MLSLRQREGFEKFYFSTSVPFLHLEQHRNTDSEIYIYFYQKSFMRYEIVWLVGAFSSNSDGLEFIPTSGIGYTRGYQLGSKKFTATQAVIPVADIVK